MGRHKSLPKYSELFHIKCCTSVRLEKTFKPVPQDLLYAGGNPTGDPVTARIASAVKPIFVKGEQGSEECKGVCNTHYPLLRGTSSTVLVAHDDRGQWGKRIS